MREPKMPTTPKRNVAMDREKKNPAMLAKHEMMIRREPNHNVHVITPHGHVQSGRKGRSA
ncbi:hypothetical protein [Geomonas edaphica]|uniref:hypothetical protein n=1 Tax=Geomonas edaphica TaxID=2570226 RepID=UPI0010A84AAA|nr:hypothetical protein [Geomonas edaphica]